MKKNKLTILCLCALFMASCGGNASQNNNSEVETTETEEVAQENVASNASISINDKFAFAGLNSQDLVPSFAVEISETQKSLAGDHPQKDGIYFYTGEVVTVVSVAQLNTYFEKVFETAKAASADGKLYKPGLFGDTQLRGEITEPVKVEKSFGEFSCCFKNNDKWFRLDVSHKVQHQEFVKEYAGEKYCGVKVYVQEYNVTE